MVCEIGLSHIADDADEHLCTDKDAIMMVFTEDVIDLNQPSQHILEIITFIADYGSDQASLSAKSSGAISSLSSAGMGAIMTLRKSLDKPEVQRDSQLSRLIALGSQ